MTTWFASSPGLHIWWRMPCLYPLRALCGHLVATGRPVLIDGFNNVKHDGCPRARFAGSAEQ